ncbi:MAG: hypothetical protein WD448_04940 [Woeseia sp.]
MPAFEPRRRVGANATMLLTVRKYGAYLAQGLVDRAPSYDDGPAAALAVAAELRRRQAAGVRFRPARERQSDGDSGTSVTNHSA